MKRIFLFFTIALIALHVAGQTTTNAPKLVVGIVVDQMRNDYLQRYDDLYGKDGFKRLINEGHYCANHHFSYTPTVTGPGHASVYTGTTPAVHGIVANNWYDPIRKREMYCSEDKSVKTVGIDNADGQMSPKNLQVTAITDELRLFWNMRSKVIGISLKDRGAILPAGRSGQAYWYSKGRFITSTWYMNELPQWVSAFNDRKLPEQYISRGWNLLYPIERYTASLPDDNPYEKKFAGETASVFPKDLNKLTKENGADFVIKQTPYGNTLVLDFAKAAILEEGLGKDGITDFLAVSFSTPDYMGHAMGPRAVEVQDMYLRLDREIADFLKFLDRNVGKGQYVVFLTADHGGAEVPNYALSQKLPGGYIDMKALRRHVDSTLVSIHPEGATFVEKIDEVGLFFDRDKVRAAGLELKSLSAAVARDARRIEGFYHAIPAELIINGSTTEAFPLLQLQRGLYPPLAPDVVFVPASGWIEYGPVGTTHGSPWPYDTHVPFIIMGKGVKKGKTLRETHIRDIAPTLSMLLGIPLPSGATGSPVTEAIAVRP